MMDIIEKPSPNQSSRGGGHPRMIVIHGDAGTTDAGTISWVQNPASKVSYHYLIGRDGKVYRFVPDHLKAWHAGKSEWDGFVGVNTIAIGVAFANNGTGNETYTKYQYPAGAELVADLCRKYRIPCDMIRGHYEVSPGRKTDPWTWFNWSLFYEMYGMFSGGRYDQMADTDRP